MTSAAPVRLDDPTFYPIEEKVGEDSLQTFVAELFRILVDRWLVVGGRPTFVGADQFIYWVQHRPQKVVAPDVYVLPGVAREARISCLKVWEAGVVPSFALEIVSPSSVDKDYREVPDRYAELGVAELVVFDPDYRKGRDRLRLQVFRRVRGRFVQVAATREDRVRSRVLGCWVRSVGKGEHVRLRLGTGERGDALVPTEAEAEHARAEQERTRAEQAEEEIARLSAEIERIKGGRWHRRKRDTRQPSRSRRRRSDRYPARAPRIFWRRPRRASTCDSRGTDPGRASSLRLPRPRPGGAGRGAAARPGRVRVGSARPRCGARERRRGGRRPALPGRGAGRRRGAARGGAGGRPP
jgi:hypothetical protein